MGADQWKLIVVILTLLGIMGTSEWFVTYCVFSDYCPLVVTIADAVAL
jgi:hypothetical protein